MDFGFAIGLAILWTRPLGEAKSPDIPTAIVALVAFVVGMVLAVATVERRLPALRAKRDPAKKRVVKKDMQIVGWVVGFVTLFTAEIATGFDGPANFAMMLGLGVTISFWYATEALGPIRMLAGLRVLRNQGLGERAPDIALSAERAEWTSSDGDRPRLPTALSRSSPFSRPRSKTGRVEARLSTSRES